ncbi:MAG TPA: PspC domain-containing protein [Prolixibacteraceae bacterium]|nr:PspC domain-containing protein [Prolixibacteraceae bacterium]
MKKTFTINISGSVFHIDEDAYEKLQKYLQMLNRHFGPAAEGQEILQDIEARIAEILLENTNNKIEVVTNDMVDKVIARMGKPEDFMEPEEEEPLGRNRAEETSQAGDAKFRRRLYRDGDSRVLGGVCSGMAAYFNMDTVILRVIFFLLFFLIGPFNILLYFILWIAVPKAKTTAQRLEMRGKEATVSNIEKSIKEEMNEVGESYNKFMNSPSNEKGQSRIERFGDMITSLLRVVLRVIVLVFGSVLIIGGIAALIGFVTSMAVGHSFLSGGPWNFGWNSEIDFAALINNFVSPGAYIISLVSISILVGIPILLILFIGTKLLFRYKTNNRLIGLGTFGLWLIALITLIVVSVNQVSNFAKQTSQTTTQKVDCTQCKTLYLETTDDLYESLIDNEINLDRMKIAMVNGKEKILGHPRFTIEKSNGNEFLLLIKKESRGRNIDDAQLNADQINYNFAQKDSTVIFEPYYFLKDNARWRNQEVSMILKVPVGKSVYLDERMAGLISNIENTENMWDGDMIGKTWTMTADGLALKQEAILKK